MHPKKNHPNEYIKVQSDEDHPLVRAMNRTGYGLEDVAALTCIATFRLRKIINGDEPTTQEMTCLEQVLPDFKKLLG